MPQPSTTTFYDRIKVMIESNARVQFGKFGDGDQERDAGGLTWLLGG